MANIREIAETAGVSITTVSRVLNGHPYVKEEKRQKVLETIERLEYARNMHAVHLSKGFSNMIGVVLPTIGLLISASCWKESLKKLQRKAFTFRFIKQIINWKKKFLHWSS